jgi:hypothetical protein
MLQRTALLLAHHMDVICEWPQDLDNDPVGEATVSVAQGLKRKLEAKVPPTAKKATRDEK